MQQHPPIYGHPEPGATMALDIAALAALDAALARDHAAQARAEDTRDTALRMGFAAALASVGEAAL